jgi:hypothetical protein
MFYDIVLKVQQAFEEYPAECSNRIFLTLHAFMGEVLMQLGRELLQSSAHAQGYGIDARCAPRGIRMCC